MGARGSEEAASTPTGYSSGEVQRITVYYNGTRYWYTAKGFDHPLEDGFEKVGEVGRVDDQEYPEEEFGGTRLDTGQEIYASREDASKIYVKYDSDYAALQIPPDQSGHRIISHGTDGTRYRGFCRLKS